MPTKKKEWYKSKVLIINGLTVLGIAITSVVDGHLIQGPVLAYATCALAIINGILRIGTDSKIGK